MDTMTDIMTWFTMPPGLVLELLRIRSTGEWSPSDLGPSTAEVGYFRVFII